jgi:hypothetical protein
MGITDYTNTCTYVGKDIQLEGKWTQTLTHEQFLFTDDGNADKILMFTTARNLTNLVSADIIYGDGTFYTSPTQFTQLYTQVVYQYGQVHIESHDWIIYFNLLIKNIMLNCS